MLYATTATTCTVSPSISLGLFLYDHSSYPGAPGDASRLPFELSIDRCRLIT
jgi:hypothetical protein